jgi:hypothetical protein
MEGFETQNGGGDPFNEAMVLFEDIVEGTSKNRPDRVAGLGWRRHLASEA